MLKVLKRIEVQLEVNILNMLLNLCKEHTIVLASTRNTLMIFPHVTIRTDTAGATINSKLR